MERGFRFLLYGHWRRDPQPVEAPAKERELLTGLPMATEAMAVATELPEGEGFPDLELRSFGLPSANERT